MIVAILALALSLVVMGYGVAWMFGGSKLAIRYTHYVGRGLSHIATWVGRRTGQMVMRYPRVVGALILIAVALVVVSVSRP